MCTYIRLKNIFAHPTFINSIAARSQVQCRLMMYCVSLSVVVLHSTFTVFPLARGQEEMGKLSRLLQFNFTFSTGIQISVKDPFS